MSKKHASASLDKTAIILTISIVAIVLVICYHLTTLIIKSRPGSISFYVHILQLTFLQASLWLSWLFAPSGYLIDSTHINILRPIGAYSIKLNDIKQVSWFPENKIKFTTRTFGVGGLFGYYGKFNTSGIGQIYFMTTQRKNLILIQTKKGKKTVISPNETCFIDSIQDKLLEVST